MLSRSHIPLFGQMAIAILLAAALAGCAAAAEGDAGVYADTDREGIPPEANEALRQMAQYHDIEAANGVYAKIAGDRYYETYGTTGLAVTDTLLVPGASPVDTLVEDHLGGEPVDGDVFDAQRVIYADGGILYWSVRGISWEGGPDSDGIKEIISSPPNRLPWSQERLESIATFSEGLTTVVEEMIPSTLALEDPLLEIEDDIDTVLGSEDSFPPLFVPGETFHDEQLTLKVGRSELAVIAAGLAAIRGLIHFASAYRWDWSLDRAFKTHPEERRTGESDSMNETWTNWDYSVEFLDGRLLRTVSADRQDELQKARSAFEKSLRYLEVAIEQGVDSSDDATLQWSNVDPEYAEQVREFIAALRSSLSEETTLPYTDPETSADFSPLFEEGRALPETVRWFEAREVETSNTTEIVWELREAAVQTMFVDELFAPEFDIREDNAPELTIGGERLDTFLENLAGQTRTKFRDVH